jgi:hypothetical protein
MSGTALTAALIIVALAVIIGLSLSFSLRHRSRALHHHARTRSTTKEEGYGRHRADTATSLTRLTGEQYICAAPGQTYRLQPHPSLKRKRDPPLAAARSHYAGALPKTPRKPVGSSRLASTPENDVATSPTHTGADWGSESPSSLAGPSTMPSHTNDANFEDIHLGSGSPSPGFVQTLAQTGEGTSSWGRVARDVAQRQYDEREDPEVKGKGKDRASPSIDGASSTITTGSTDKPLPRVQKPEEGKLGVFDFEREEAGAIKEKKGWRMSLFGRSEH